MCGIFAVLSDDTNYLSSDKLKYNFMKGKSRGPENSKYEIINSNLSFGFHRLAINGIDTISNQPLSRNGIYLICNGEIYNYKQIYSDLNYTPKTNSDCEAIICLYEKYGIDYTLQNLDGVFSFVLYDSNIGQGFIARDPYGVRPLYYGIVPSTSIIIFSSLLKQISELTTHTKNFQAGSYLRFHIYNDSSYEVSLPNKYTTFNYHNNYYMASYGIKQCYNIVYESLFNAVKKRVITMETDFACLLSGGLDSSLIAAFLSKYVPRGQLKTFSIGMKGGSDLQYAKMVSNHINSNHTEVIFSDQEFFQAIDEVIYNIESYDTTTVRASVGNYLVAQYISKNTNAKVLFNGDGSDELTGGYMYFHKCPNDIEFDFECKRLLNQLQYYDVLRSDRTISCHGLEARTPFLDRSFVDKYLSLPIEYRNHNNGEQIEKWLLRKSIEMLEPNLLPQQVLWRTKEAFSDGVSSQEKSWFEIINDKLEDMYNENEFNIKVAKYNFNKPTTKEQLYYREIFEKYYPGKGDIIPAFWMPKYTNATDSSARSLNVYKEKMKLEEN
jgi:asparagine synthase (glutamine-hydrolysing)